MGGNYVFFYIRVWICFGVYVYFDRVDVDGWVVVFFGNIFDIVLVEEELFGIEMFVWVGCQVDVVCLVGNYCFVELNVVWFCILVFLRI